MPHFRIKAIAVAASAFLLTACGGNDHTSSPTSQKLGFQSLISVPNIGPAPGFDFDLGLVDQASRTYFLSDRTNASIDIVDTRTNTLVAQIGGYVGQKPSNSNSGPNGMERAGNFLYTGDGNSTVKIIDLTIRTIVKTIPTGGTKRTDAFAFDPADNLMIAANKNETVPFVSFLDTTSMTIVGVLPIPSSQLDSIVFDPTTKKFWVSVTSTLANPGGEIDAVDPITRSVTAVYPVTQCLPGGLAIGPNDRLLVGCSGDAIAAGFPASTLVLDAATGSVLKTITEVGGSDEVAYDPSNQRFYTASRDMTSNGLLSGTPTPVLGVIDAQTLTFIQSVPTSKNSKSVAVDATTHQVYVPLTDVPGPGIGVFGQVPS